MRFRDIVYGQIELPDWLSPFVRSPEFVRLRGVGLSNVDSVELKDFNGPSRWEHGIAVAWLAQACAASRRLSTKQAVELILAGLLHDVATPPFAHTAEYVLANFDHEAETQNILAARVSDDAFPDAPVFGSELPQFRHLCEQLARHVGFIDPDEVARMVVGDGDLGHLIAGAVDLDNLDNVTRACMYLGWDVDRGVPPRLARWLGHESGPPVDLERIDNPDLRLWLEYRQRLYSTFYNASDEEAGREAFLQHMMRRALAAGMPRRVLVWNTEEHLLATMANTVDDVSPSDYPTLRELVRRYRLLEPNHRLAAIAIEDEETFRALRSPQAGSWIEGCLSGPNLEVSVKVAARRWAGGNGERLIAEPPGALLVFKLGSDWSYEQLPEWLKATIPVPVQGRQLRQQVARVLAVKVRHWAKERPWLAPSNDRRQAFQDGLDSIGDWSFRLSRNDSFHAYPSTFVHAIPASLISALGLRGELIVDPFGGTGQTAVEAIKYGGSAITGDANRIATLVARARLTYLDADQRRSMRSLTDEEIRAVSPAPSPEFPLRDKWHHEETLEELCYLLAFILNCRNASVQQFLKACFSAILPDTTSRHGRQHGFFADNTPLSRDQRTPLKRDAIKLFLDRLRRNLDLVDRLYSFIVRAGGDPEQELLRVRVLRQNALTACPADYGVSSESVAALITSPPYLGMADYTLGSRLSYYWLEPEGLERDFAVELGARRRRFTPESIVCEYFSGMTRFGMLARSLLRHGGLLAMVLGVPEARAFRDREIMNGVDSILATVGFELMWWRVRPISWHRNHGYQRLRTERVAVYVKK